MIHEATMLALISEAESIGLDDLILATVKVAREHGHSAVGSGTEAFVDCMDADRCGGETFRVNLVNGLPEPEYMQRFIVHESEQGPRAFCLDKRYLSQILP